jgi:DnaJ-class molecular chaperone
MDDPYAVLGITRDSSREQIQTAYRRLVKELHPDRHSNELDWVQKEERLKKVNTAYRKLKKGFFGSTYVRQNADEVAKQATARKPQKTEKCEAAENGAHIEPEAASTRFWEAFNKMEQEHKHWKEHRPK